MSYKYILQKKSTLCTAVKHVLEMFSVSPDHIITEGDHFAVKVGPMVHIGILPLLTVLRSTTNNAELQAFIGTDADVRPLVNQWVSTALLLSADAVDYRPSSCTTPLAKHVFAELERNVESFQLQKSFLAGTSRATVADLLLHAAIYGHPNGLTEALPSTLAWLLYAQADAYIVPILTASAVEVASAASAAKIKKATHVKPSDEEILRRRQEKELAHAKQAQTEGSVTSSSDAKGSKAQKKEQKEPAEINPNWLDIRVGRFTNVKQHPEADRLYVEEMDIGTEKRTIVSGLVGHYTPEELEGTLCLTLCNMKAKALKGIKSHGMVLCASNESTLRLIRPPVGAQPGDRIMFGDMYNAEALQEAKQLSTNAMSELIGFLCTDCDGVMRWQHIPAQHVGGEIKIPEVTNATVK